ncbi:nicastrin-like [Gryllus bimaculatus]|nr:nicastrin-like [Gryllus bimaculatus]
MTMAPAKIYVVAVVIFVLTFNPVYSERMKSKIYDSIEGAACFRRLNGTHQFGCTSRRLGNVGVIHLIASNKDLTWLLNEGEAMPYMTVMYPAMFTRDSLLKLKNSGKVNGIALINNGSIPEHFTHEDTCPNRYSGLSSNETCDAKNPLDVWNPHGTKLLMEDWGFPIFYIKKDIEKIMKCYNDYNSNGRNKKNDRSLCAMEMTSFMFATVDSATCIRRSKMVTNFNPMKFCDPLGSRNVWSTLFPRFKNASSEQNETVYVVASRMDTSSLFDGVTPGAVSPVSGIVALMSTAQILSKIFKNIKGDRRTASFITDMKNIGLKLGLQFSERKDGKLPPASLQTFIAEGGSAPVPGVIIADYYKSFTTKYYHSIFDDAKALDYEYQNGNMPSPNSIQAFVANVSTTLGHTLYKMLMGKTYTGTVDEIFHCYLKKMNCSLFQQASFNMMLNDEPASLYVGVHSWRGPNYQITSLTGQTLAYLTGDFVNKTEKDCVNNPLQQVYQYIWVKGNITDGDAEYDWSSGQFSTWTESVWQELSVRVFLKPSRAHEIKIFSVGAVVFGLSFIIVYFLNARSHILFGNTLGTGAC